jgi:hypothetical protein
MQAAVIGRRKSDLAEIAHRLERKSLEGLTAAT